MKYDFDTLRKAVDWSIEQLQTPRLKRVEAIRQYVGMHYFEGGSEKRVPTNFLELAVTIYARQLAARAPRVLVTAKNQQLRPYAKSMEIALNQIPDEINLGDTLHKAVMEALFSFAVAKVGMCSTNEEILGQEYGESFVDLVSIDDYFCDMSAKARNTMQFEGNDYWLNIDAAREIYDGKGAKIEPDEHTVTGDRGEERAEQVSSGESGEVYRDKVWLRDVWLPMERRIVTYGVKSKQEFRVIDWDGPDHGPYHVLGFSDVPGNLLPLPPIALWRDLHELGNSLFRKLGRQADSKKTVAAFAGGNDEDIEALKRASDGEGIRYTGQKPESIAVGGVDAPTLAFFLQIKDLTSYFAGNVDSLGGLSPQSDTIGQDKMLQEAASTRVKHMADKTIDFAKEIFKSLAWYEWTDPVRERSIQKPVKGTNIQISTKWSKETRRGKFLDYNFSIDVYSMQDDTPATKLQKIGVALERFIFPMLPQMEQQGGQIDFKALTELIAQLANVPELNDIVRFVDPPVEQEVKGDPHPERAAKPPHTTRTYERVNRPGATRHGKDDVMSRLLMGQGVQQAEEQAMGRMVS